MKRKRTAEPIKAKLVEPMTYDELVELLARYENIDPDPEHLAERLERAEGRRIRRKG